MCDLQDLSIANFLDKKVREIKDNPGYVFKRLKEVLDAERPKMNELKETLKAEKAERQALELARARELETRM